ncbi:substrate-binding periplasmic protein [Vibrio sp. HN007]|uniref:substrate-binding periplasmic protein n=1 Tax=Vibrio iocasae TaxID=3098914 RepID=UPI0035D49E1D
MCRNYLVIAILCLLSLPVGAKRSSEVFSQLQFYTEEYPPYNFIENKKTKGVAVDLLQESAELLNSELQGDAIKFRPWARSYRTALRQKNAVLFSAARTEFREDLFQWVGPIAQTRVVLIAKKNSGILVEDKKDIRYYSIGVMIDDVGEQLLTKDDAILDNRIDVAYSAEALAHMLMHDRIDLWAYEERAALHAIKKAGYSPNDFQLVYNLQTVDLYFALNKAVPSETVLAFQNAVDLITKASGARNDSTFVNRYGENLEVYWEGN